ncbi:uncharacterized protein BDR25DRAFT_382564 [Lindgomyces ingoldianus]|uniref:Uncharacterized protein n=1 Tax=Lindgomyces ingoldianus TaxID=673940 RepID=A0ACB6RB08_9PLEO|nr:uncharacterized protein BDR25DRAFT_382564 [Lindgomyces ingoldianus]KAF2475535.1 hypothetical protein BDR25DRAFT_382564 [Lindgomyces ingoldianus]
MATNNSNPRHQPCYILHDHGIPCVVWFEDAVAYYGVPTIVFDLYVLVSDIDSRTGAYLKWMDFCSTREGQNWKCKRRLRTASSETTTSR